MEERARRSNEKFARSICTIHLPAPLPKLSSETHWLSPCVTFHAMPRFVTFVLCLIIIYIISLICIYIKYISTVFWDSISYHISHHHISYHISHHTKYHSISYITSHLMYITSPIHHIPYTSYLINGGIRCVSEDSSSYLMYVIRMSNIWCECHNIRSHIAVCMTHIAHFAISDAGSM